MKASSRNNTPSKPRVEIQERTHDEEESTEEGSMQDEGRLDMIGRDRPASVKSEDFRTEAKKENDWNEIKNKKNKRTRKRSRFPKKRPFDASLLLCALIPYELGTSGIDRIQLCQMGRHDASGAYQVLAEVKLFPDESSEKEDGNTIPQASSDGG